MAIVVLVSYIAGVIKAIRVENCSRRLRIVVIPFHHISTTHEDLAVRFGDLHFNPVKGLADRTDLVVVGPVSTGHAGLGHTVALQDGNASAPKGIAQLFRQWSPA